VPSLTEVLVSTPVLVAALLVVAPPVPAQERRTPNSAVEVRHSYAPVVQLAAPAVVNVYAAAIQIFALPFLGKKSERSPQSLARTSIRRAADVAAPIVSGITCSAVYGCG
jgi:hypothetical protein